MREANDVGREAEGSERFFREAEKEAKRVWRGANSFLMTPENYKN